MTILQDKIDEYNKRANLRVLKPWQRRVFIVIFGTDTPAGKLFDVVLLILILASVLAVILETVTYISIEYARLLFALEWVFTIFFTIEYILRLTCVRNPLKYATSFFGVVDLLSILPAYIGIIIAGSHSLLVFRALRLLRVFRIFKLGRFLNEGSQIINALKASRAKITVFIFFVLVLSVIIGAIMYLVEGDTNPQFTSIPKSIYWTIVTLTTVGYGDIAPATPFGQFLAAFVMIMGYGVIAVPTGIVTAEIVTTPNKKNRTKAFRVCKICDTEGHMNDATYCKYCGSKLDE